MRINRAAFFAGVRRAFGPLKQDQVDTISAVLALWERSYTAITPLVQLAYCFATAWHESRLRPIREIGGTAYFHRMYDPRGARPKVARTLGNTIPGDGALFCGRGLVQLTGRANYTKATARLRALGILSPEQSLVANPELALDIEVAVVLLLEGMEQGWFTSRNLDRTIDPEIDGDEHADFLAARAIINGRDRAELIANHADAFLKILLAAVETKPSKPPVTPAPRRIPPAAPPTAPLSRETSQPASSGLFAALARLLAAFRRSA